METMIGSQYHFAGDLSRAADVARVLVKYGLAGWLADINWEPIHDALKSHDGEVLSDEPFEARVRLDTLTEVDYCRHGGVLPFVLRDLASR